MHHRPHLLLILKHKNEQKPYSSGFCSFYPHLECCYPQLSTGCAQLFVGNSNADESSVYLFNKFGFQRHLAETGYLAVEVMPVIRVDEADPLNLRPLFDDIR